MSCARPEDIELVAGNNYPPTIWQFLESENPDVPFPIDGSQFYLSIIWPGGSFRRDSVNHPSELVIDEALSKVTWNFSVETSRLLPANRIARYELERRIAGTEQTFIRGGVLVNGGINAD